MIIGNDKPIRVIGYPQSTTTQEYINEISRSHVTTVLLPDEFVAIKRKGDYQYIVSISKDLSERHRIVQLIDRENLDLITVISDYCILGQSPPPIIGAGTFIFPFCLISLGSQIGKHCVIGSYSLIGHYSAIDNNCILRPSVMVTDKSSVGKNCVLNLRSVVTNKSHVADNVTVMAFSSVTKNITESGNYIGTPVRRYQNNA